MKTIYFLVAFFVSIIAADAQVVYDFGENTPNPNKMLLLNMGVQTEAGKAINYMYNFQFAEAEREYNWFKLKYPTHPMPYFLLGLNEWWKIVPNTDNPMYDDRCLAFMDSTIARAETMYDDTDNKLEAAFFLSAAYGFKGRLYAERKKWTKAALAGKSSLKYLEKSRGYATLSPELLLGDGLYNYYKEWIPANYPMLKPILWLFPNGNKEQGISQLEKVAYNAYYTRMEARYFLLQIYSMENQHEKCYEMAKYMWQNFPQNSYFHRSYAREAFVTGHIAEAESTAQIILERLAAHQTGYETVAGRYASYILGYINQHYNHNNIQAKEYYNKAIGFALLTDAKQSGYYLSSLLSLGKIAESEDELDVATNYYQQVADQAEKKASQRPEAERLLKGIKNKIKEKKREARRKKN